MSESAVFPAPVGCIDDSCIHIIDRDIARVNLSSKAARKSEAFRISDGRKTVHAIIRKCNCFIDRIVL